MFKGALYEFDGEMLSVKTIAGRVSLSPSTIYKYLKDGYSIDEAISFGKKQSSKSFKNRPKTNNRDAKKYPYLDGQNLTVEEIAKLEGISKEPLYRRLRKGMTAIEAVNDIKSNIAVKYPYLNGYYSKWSISNISGVPIYYLNKNISDDDNYTEEEITAIVDGYRKDNVYMYEGISLYQYCVLHQYNYNVIYHLLRYQNLTVQEAIKQYIEKGQLARFAAKHVLGDVLLSHFLIKMQIDNRYVSERLSHGCSEEEAIIDAIFLSQETYGNRYVRKKLRIIYEEISDIEDLDIIKIQYDLSADDIAFIRNKAERVRAVMLQYQLFYITSLLHTSSDTIELQAMLDNFGIEISELERLEKKLLEGFATLEGKAETKVKYVWYKHNKGEV